MDSWLSKITPRLLTDDERNRTRAKLDGIDFDLEKLLATTQPNELGLVRVEFQTIRCHPAIHLGDTVNDHRYRRSRGLCTAGQIELTLIRVAVNSEFKRLGDQWNIRRVEQEEERSKDTSPILTRITQVRDVGWANVYLNWCGFAISIVSIEVILIHLWLPWSFNSREHEWRATMMMMIILILISCYTPLIRKTNSG